MIPKVIHYCWFGNNEIDKKSEECISSWKKIMPEYKIVKWDESNYNVHKNKFIEAAYKEKMWAFVTDYARLDIIYNYGGIYFDTDVKVIKKFDNLLKYDAFMGFESEKNVNTGLGFGAVKGNRIIYQNLLEYNKIPYIDEYGNFKPIACTQITNKVLKKNGFEINGRKQKNNDIIIFPCEYFCPKDYETGIMNITDNTYSIHEFGMSWIDEKDKKWHIKEQKMKKFFGRNVGKKILDIVSFPYRVKRKIKKIGIKNTIKYSINKILKR